MRVGERGSVQAARAEHAFLLRCERLSLVEIAQRLDMRSAEGARQLILAFGRRLTRATRRARLRIER